MTPLNPVIPLATSQPKAARGQPARIFATVVLLLAGLLAGCESSDPEAASENATDGGQIGSPAGSGGLDSDGPPPPPEPDMLLLLDGRIAIREGDFRHFDEFWAEHDPTLGVRFRRRHILQQIALPIAIARDAFAEQRADAKRRAEEFAAGCGNSIELRRHGETVGGFGPEEAFNQGELPDALLPWLVNPEHIGAVSPPLETPQGFYVIGLENIVPGVTSTNDRIVAFLVPFLTHSADEFNDELATRKTELAGKVSYAHPDVSACLPDWLQGD